MDDFKLDEDGKLPMNSREYQDYLMFVGFADSVLQSVPKLEKRARLAGAWRDMRMLMTVAAKCTRALLSTIPRRKRQIIQAEMQRMRTAVLIDPPNGLPQPKKLPNFTTVPVEEMEWLIHYSLQWECLTCMKEGKDQKQCAFRQHLEKLYLFDIRDIVKGECPFRTWEVYGDD